MVVQRPRDYEQRVRALRKRLALDFQPLRDTLSRGLDVLIDSEAAVLCTATVEAMCDALLHVVVKNLHEDAAANLAPLDTKVTVYHLHAALRSHSDFAQLLAQVDSAAAVVACFLDDASSRMLYARHLLTTPEAKHLRPSPLASSASADTLLLPLSHRHGEADEEEEEVARHARTRSEWQKREDDPFQDVDFAMVLKCVHPAFTLTHSATQLLSALVRELVNAVCDVCDLDRVQRRVPPELYVEDLEGPLARVFHMGELALSIAWTSRECLERFRLRSRQGATLALRCRVFASGAPAKARASVATYAIPPVSRDAMLGNVLIQMCKMCRVDAAVHIGVYRGHTVDAASTPRALGMPTGAVVYLVRAQWWDHVRRNDARRGLLIATRISAAPRFGGEGGGGGGGEGSPTADESPPHKTKLSGGGTTLGVHTSSASRLMGVGRDRGRGRHGCRSDHKEDPCNSGEEEGGQGQEQDEEDSLGRLLRRHDLDPEGNNHPRQIHAVPSDHPLRTSSSRAELLATMASQSTQLMDTLDEAWLGFAGISASVRSIKESLQRQLEEEEEGRGHGGRNGPDALGNELRVRLEKTGELVRQTSLAHELVAQLLHGTKRLQLGTDDPDPPNERRRKRTGL